MSFSARPKLTIIIPFYDEDALLPMAVDSVLSQPIENIEVLIVNDNPQAYGPAFFDPQTRDRRVRLLTHDRNLGLSHARNTGLDQARGEWVGFLDSDDYYIPDGLARQLGFAKETRADMTHALHWKRGIGGVGVQKNGRENAMFRESSVASGLANAPRAQFINSSWCSLYSGDFINRASLRFDPEQVQYEDRLFVLQAVTQARSIAFSGQPARIYRKRGHSITTQTPSRQSDLLKLKLFAKCRTLMAQYAANDPAYEVFARREGVMTLCNFLSHPGLPERLALAKNTPEGDELAQRARELLPDYRLWDVVENDPILRQAAGFKRLKAVLKPAQDFDFLQDGLRNGHFEQIAARIAERGEEVRPSSGLSGRAAGVGAEIDKEVVLHIGLHKTGTTFLQTELLSKADTLKEYGVLIPRSGLLVQDKVMVRGGGCQGHDGLLRPLRMRVPKDENAWRSLLAEVRASDAPQVVLSCENLLVPFEVDRQNILRKLGARLSRFRKVRVVAFVRRPDDWIEALYSERVIQGAAEGQFSAGEFALDFGPGLLDLLQLFGPLEEALGQHVELLDYDAAQAGEGIWQAFWAHLGLENIACVEPAQAHGVYASLTSEVILAAHLICRILPNDEKRRRALRGFLAALPVQDAACRRPLLSRDERLLMLEMFEHNGNFAKARGYAPDLKVLRAGLLELPATKRPSIPVDLVQHALNATTREDVPPD